MDFHAIVMILLEHETDYLKFERIATDIMYQYGFHDILPYGGHKDKGVDGKAEKYFEGFLKEKAIFQFTTEANSRAKFISSLKKLQKNGINYTHFVYVTNKKITSMEKLELEDIARQEYNVTPIIFEQEAVCFYLTKDNYRLWNKYYDNPIAEFNKKESNKPLDNNHKIEVMKGFFLFLNYNKANNLYISKEYILSLYASRHPEELTISDIQKIMNIDMKIAISEENIDTMIQELVKEQFIKKIDNAFQATDAIAGKYLNFKSEIENKITSIGYRVAGAMQKFDPSITDSTYGKIVNLTHSYLIEILKRYSIDIVNSIYDSEEKQHYNIEEIVESNIFINVDEKVKNQFIPVANEILMSKDKDIEETIYSLAMNYISMYALGINPYLDELNSNNLDGKIFIVDTDFILDTIVSENRDSALNKKILKKINSSGATVFIPIECITECAQHAQISFRTFNYFRNALLNVPEEAADQTILNVFVKGYYYAQKTKKSLEFNKYILNYYDKEAPEELLIKIIEENLPFAQINKLAEIANIDEETELYRLTFDIMRTQAEKSKKAQYRNSQEIDNLAHLDTKLFLTAKSKNETIYQKSPFKHKIYVITKSSAFNISAKISGIEDHISTTKEALVTYFDIFNKKPIDKSSISKFIFSPISNFVSYNLREDIKKLAKLGIDLSDLSIARLRHDLEKELHTLLKGFSDNNISSFVDSIEYEQLMKIVDRNGYSISPSIKAIYEKKEKEVKNISRLLDEQKRENDKLKLKLRRKQRHIKKTVSTKNSKKRKR